MQEMWQYQNNALDMDQLLVNESLFTLANGYLGVRGCFEEGYENSNKSIRGTYINGVYDTLPVSHPEKLYGFTEFNDKQPNLVDLQTLTIQLDGEDVDLFSAQHEAYTRTLSLEKGFSTRSFTYITQSGKKAKVAFKRLVSLECKELFLQELCIEYGGEIKVTSVMDTNVTNYTNPDDPRVASEHSRLLSIIDVTHEETSTTALYETVHSKIQLACGCKHELVSDGDIESSLGENNGLYSVVYKTTNTLKLNKYNVYSDGIREKNPLDTVSHILNKVVKRDFDAWMQIQENHLNNFWNDSDILIEGNEEDQLSIRFNLYHLYQSVGRDKYSNISAKGLSGEGYEGHYFWDTEIYVLPTFQLNQYEISRNLLMYRYNQLDAARDRARALGHVKGVKFPWRTISGIECSAYYPAGTAQYHINGDVAHAYVQHYIFTDDFTFMMDYGLEVLLETALMWLDLGHFDKGLFKIDAVTGPDEYTAIVNNNYYTNALAKHNLEWTVRLCDKMQGENPVAFKNLLKKIDVSLTDLDQMDQAAKNMFLPHDKTLGIDMQDDGFLSKKVWDFENTPKSHYPLLLHYHPLTIYRYQVIKQPDTVLAHFLLEEYTDFDTMKKSFDYYEAITTHDSSLSPCVYGIMASRLGYREKAYVYFGDSLKLDLENTHGNTKDGLHMANMAGTALSIIYGFAGLRISDKGVSLRPWLPDVWEGISFKMQFRGRLVKLNIDSNLTIELLEGEPIQLKIYDETHQLNDKIFLPLKG